MMPHQKHPKNNPYFFPQFFFLVYEKKTHVKNIFQLKKLLVLLKIINIYTYYIYIFNMVY